MGAGDSDCVFGSFANIIGTYLPTMYYRVKRHTRQCLCKMLPRWFRRQDTEVGLFDCLIEKRKFPHLAVVKIGSTIESCKKGKKNGRGDFIGSVIYSISAFDQQFRIRTGIGLSNEQGDHYIPGKAFQEPRSFSKSLCFLTT